MASIVILSEAITRNREFSLHKIYLFNNKATLSDFLNYTYRSLSVLQM
jgi:hypothetical protein